MMNVMGAVMVNVMMISQASSEHSICFAVRSHEAGAAVKALNKRFEKAIAAGRIKEVTVVDECAILAAVGQNMCQTPGVSAMLFEALANASVNPHRRHATKRRRHVQHRGPDTTRVPIAHCSR